MLALRLALRLLQLPKHEKNRGGYILRPHCAAFSCFHINTPFPLSLSHPTSPSHQLRADTLNSSVLYAVHHVIASCFHNQKPHDMT